VQQSNILIEFCPRFVLGGDYVRNLISPTPHVLPRPPRDIPAISQSHWVTLAWSPEVFKNQFCLENFNGGGDAKPNDGKWMMASNDAEDRWNAARKCSSEIKYKSETKSSSNISNLNHQQLKCFVMCVRGNGSGVSTLNLNKKRSLRNFIQYTTKPIYFQVYPNVSKRNTLVTNHKNHCWTFTKVGRGGPAQAQDNSKLQQDWLNTRRFQVLARLAQAQVESKSLQTGSSTRWFQVSTRYHKK
jgi:hypothetical protein